MARRCDAPPSSPWTCSRARRTRRRCRERCTRRWRSAASRCSAAVRSSCSKRCSAAPSSSRPARDGLQGSAGYRCATVRDRCLYCVRRRRRPLVNARLHLLSVECVLPEVLLTLAGMYLVFLPRAIGGSVGSCACALTNTGQPLLYLQQTVC